MAAKPKTRRYDSTRRREQAAVTRRKILEAAEALFVRDGYVATSMAAIAKDAGVALKTVYLAFETKSGLLRALWNLRLRGDEAPVPVGERPWYQAVLEEPDPEKKLRMLIGGAAKIRARIGPVLEIVRGGAPADPEVGALWERMQREFYENQRTAIQSLKKGALKRGLTLERAADILWTLNNPTVFLLLVNDRGWTLAQQEKWTGDVACRELLR